MITVQFKEYQEETIKLFHVLVECNICIYYDHKMDFSNKICRQHCWTCLVYNILRNCIINNFYAHTALFHVEIIPSTSNQHLRVLQICFQQNSLYMYLFPSESVFESPEKTNIILLTDHARCALGGQYNIIVYIAIARWVRNLFREADVGDSGELGRKGRVSSSSFLLSFTVEGAGVG